MNDYDFSVIDHTSIEGAYPTMITPMDADGHVDYAAVEALVEWYWKQGCDGIFASCQSSEIWFLSEDDRVRLAETVKKKADALAAADPSRKPMIIVASGHVSDHPEDQVRELTRVAASGVDALILITNRMDIANTSDEQWIRETAALIERLPEDTALGLYECPKPYKRLISPKMLAWCLSTGRFRYIKDTCCDAQMIEERMQMLRGTKLKLFNANAQTLLPSLQSGAAGYCGVMANFHPALYVWLTHHYDQKDQKMVVHTADFLSLAAFTESLSYPVTAKYYLNQHEHVKMKLSCLSRDPKEFTAYHAACMDQMYRLACDIETELNLKEEK